MVDKPNRFFYISEYNEIGSWNQWVDWKIWQQKIEKENSLKLSFGFVTQLVEYHTFKMEAFIGNDEMNTTLKRWTLNIE